MSAEPRTTGLAERAARARRAAGSAALIVIAVLGGCDRNPQSPRLVPTGVQPRPATGTGAVVGRIVYDPVQSPDLDTPPYPPTIVTLAEAGEVVAADTLEATRREFAFHSLPPGTYTVIANARLFRRSSLPPVRVVADPVDVGDLIAPIDLDQLTTISIHVSGDFNGFTETADTCSMQQVRLGLWYGPDFDPTYSNTGEEILPDTALTLEAGVHDLRFITNYSIYNPFYGGDPATVIDAPVVNAPLRITDDPAGTFRVRIPATGRYRFYLDERRIAVTIEQLPAAGPAARRMFP